jgi:hypothetical protein
MVMENGIEYKFKPVAIVLAILGPIIGTAFLEYALYKYLLNKNEISNNSLMNQNHGHLKTKLGMFDQIAMILAGLATFPLISIANMQLIKSTIRFTTPVNGSKHKSKSRRSIKK